jgi:DNA invertase Pin-like site-specific DNA recombinase
LDQTALLDRGHKRFSRSFRNRWYQLQKNRIRRFAYSQGLKLFRIYYDPEFDIVGDPKRLPLLKRQKFIRLVLQAERLGIHTVLVDRRVRVTRSPTLLALICEHFRMLNLRLIETESETDLTADQGIRNRLAEPDALLRKYRALLARWKAKLSRIRAGRLLGRKPFGSRPGEAEVVDRLLALYRVLPKDQWRRRRGKVEKHRSFQEMAETLNKEGFPTRSGGVWKAGTVRGILKRLKKLR